MLSREERARQFMPFDALKGFKDALKQKEKEHIERKELSEEEIEKISNMLKILEQGCEVCITYYIDEKYVTEKIVVKQIDSIKQRIITGNEKSIKFVDILGIEIR